jgi:hypothetical protein
LLINITTEIHHLAGNSGQTGELNENTFVHFGTLRVRAVQVQVLTSQPAEDTQSFHAADQVFDHIRARLIDLAKEIEKELGIGWAIMVEEGD